MIFFNEYENDTAAVADFYEEAGLLGPDSRVICLVGAGGKTSTLFALAESYAARGFSVAVTTTTHMGKPRSPIVTREADLRPAAGRVTFCAEPVENAEKVKGPGFVDKLPELFDVVLIEADGSRRLPIKVPASYEPVLPDTCDTVLVLAGLSALGRPLGEVCHRLEHALELLDKTPEDPVTEEDIGRLLLEGYARPFLQKYQGGIVLNQADSPELLVAAKKTGESLKDFPLLAQRLRGHSL